MATEIDVTASGASEEASEGVTFVDSSNINSGTGNYNTFLALGDNDGIEEGFNSDFNDATNPDINAAKTRTFQVQDLAIVDFNGVDCYEFRIDLNEVRSGDNELISLDMFKIYISGSGGVTSLADLLAADLVYDLDDGDDRTVLLRQDSSGGGNDDYSIFIPVSLFTNAGAAGTDYVYVYTQFGATGDDYAVSDGFEEVRALLNADIENPQINVTKEVSSVDPGGNQLADSAGDIINYTITIANTGNVDLTGVTVTDNVEAQGATNATYVSGDGGVIGVLDVGETWTFSASYVLTQADLDNAGYGTPAGDLPGDGFLDNVATGDTEETPEDTAVAQVPLVYNPAIEVTKTVDSIDDDDDFGGSGQADSAGDTINYLITIANTGNISLTGITVTDNVEGFGATNATYVSGDAGTIGVLDVGETWTFSASYVLTQADLDSAGYGTPAGDLPGDGFLDNVATGDTNETPEDTANAQVPLVYAPHVDIEKLVSVDGGLTYFDADSPTGPPADGENVTDILFKFIVTNDGNISLTGVDVTDTDFDLNGLDPGTNWAVPDLAPGDSEELVITVPFEIGQHTDTGTVTTDQDVTDSDDANYFGFQGPGVRTPGFWQSKYGGQFWDGQTGNEQKAGEHCFADGELTYAVDSNGNGTILAPPDKKGLLIGDYDMDGIKDPDENVLFIDLNAAKALIQANEKDVQDGRWLIGRDLVATWLNYLAGNPVGDDDPSDGHYSPRESIDDAIAWLKLFGDTGSNGIGFVSGKPQFEGTAVKTSSAGWQVDISAFVESGKEIHAALDEYNNFGTVNGHVYANDADDSIFCNLLATI